MKCSNPPDATSIWTAPTERSQVSLRTLEHLRQPEDVAERSLPLETSSEYANQSSRLSRGVACRHGNPPSCDLVGYWVRMWLLGWGYLMSAMSGPASCALITPVWGCWGKVTRLRSALRQTFLGANMSPTAWQWSQVRWSLIWEFSPGWRGGRCCGTGAGVQMIWQSDYL